MVEFLLLFVTLLLAILGLSELIHMLKIKITYPTKKNKNYILIILTKENATEQIKYIADKLQWSGKNYADGVFAIYNDEVDLNSCYDLVSRYNIMLCSPEELALLLKQEL